MCRGTMSTESSVYLKSMIAGALAVLASAVAASVVAVVALIWMSSRTETGSYGWDPVAFARTPLAWTIFLVSFVVGFWWKYRTLVAH